MSVYIYRYVRGYNEDKARVDKLNPVVMFYKTGQNYTKHGAAFILKDKPSDVNPEPIDNMVSNEIKSWRSSKN